MFSRGFCMERIKQPNQTLLINLKKVTPPEQKLASLYNSTMTSLESC